MTNPNNHLSVVHQLLEILVLLITVVTPIIGMFWYFESKLTEIDKKMIRLEHCPTSIIGDYYGS